MSGGIPAWAVPGAKCTPILGGVWVGVNCPENTGPKDGEIVTVAWAHTFFVRGEAEAYIGLIEWPGDAFTAADLRPVIDRPGDAALFTARLFEGFQGVGADDPAPRVMPRDPAEVPFG